MTAKPCIRVLIVDDHAVLRHGLCLMLESRPEFTIAGEAKSGREALRMLADTKPDVILMDIGMRDMNGIATVGRITEHNASINVVMLSMHADSEHVYQALAAGAKGYVLKDSSPDDVIAAILAASEGKRFFSAEVTDLIARGFTAGTAAMPGHDPLASLSPRELEVLQCVVEGKTSAEIASDINLSPKTVDTYRSRIMEKLNVRDMPALVKFAIIHGVTSLDS